MTSMNFRNGSNWPKWPPVNLRILNNLTLAALYSNWAISGSGRYGANPEHQFSRTFAHYIGRQYCVTTANGSSAIVVALQALGIKPADKVVVPATTWVGCATAILRVGAIPVFFDTDRETLLARPEDGQADPAAILVIHTYASRADVDHWRSLFPGVPIIEDCSHCHGGLRSNGERLGNRGDIAVFSFQASKLLTAGEGGCAVTDDVGLAEKMAALRADSRIQCGDGEYCKLVPAKIVHGANYAMSELQAAVLMAMLPTLDEMNRSRAGGAEHFVQILENTPIKIAANRSALEDGAFYGLPLILPKGTSPDTVKWGVADALGIDLDYIYPPIPISPLYLPQTQPFFHKMHAEKAEFKEAEAVWRSAIVIPHWYLLAPDHLLDYLAETIKSSISSNTVMLPSSKRKPPTVTVAILSRNRSRLIQRALASVDKQDYKGDINILVLVDGADDRKAWTPPTLNRARLSVVEIPRTILDSEPIHARIARMRNVAVQLAGTDLFAFLDDDNEWAPDHLSSLWSAMEVQDTPAAYSWRKLVDRNGTPHAPTTFPWIKGASAASAAYDAAIGAGLFVSGSPIIRDASIARWNGEDVGMVDMGEWLFHHELLDAIRFERLWNDSDIETGIGEDDLLLQSLKDINVPIAATQKPTLIYRLGGFSNAHYFALAPRE